MLDDDPRNIAIKEETAKDEDRLLNLRGALAERAQFAIREAGMYTDQKAYASGFLAGLEHARLVCDLLEGIGMEVSGALVEEERDFRAEFDR